MPTAKRKTSEYLEKQIRGHKAVIGGMTLEKSMGQRLSKRGYTIEYERLVSKASKDKFDVFGYKEDFLGGREYLIVECKKKLRVTPNDVLHFMSKLRKFYESLPEDILGNKVPVQALLAYTGELPKDAQDAAKGFKPSIKFEKV